MGEIGGPQMAGEGTAKRSSSEVLPEMAVETPRIETGFAFRIETHRELSPFDQGKAGTRPRKPSHWAYELEPGVDQFQSDAVHDIQFVPTRCERSGGAVPAWR